MRIARLDRRCDLAFSLNKWTIVTRWHRFGNFRGWELETSATLIGKRIDVNSRFANRARDPANEPTVQDGGCTVRFIAVFGSTASEESRNIASSSSSSSSSASSVRRRRRRLRHRRVALILTLDGGGGGGDPSPSSSCAAPIPLLSSWRRRAPSSSRLRSPRRFPVRVVVVRVVLAPNGARVFAEGGTRAAL